MYLFPDRPNCSSAELAAVSLAFKSTLRTFHHKCVSGPLRCLLSDGSGPLRPCEEMSSRTGERKEPFCPRFDPLAVTCSLLEVMDINFLHRNPSCSRATRGPSRKSNTTGKEICCSLWLKTPWVDTRSGWCAVCGGGCESKWCVSLKVANVWYSVNGERLGTYNGHTGAVWCVDCDCILSPNASCGVYLQLNRFCGKVRMSIVVSAWCFFNMSAIRGH